jgi:hypothetical protein
MPKRLAKKPAHNCSGGHAPLRPPEPLPPYELDSMFDDPAIRNRVGEVIAKAMEKRFSKN